MTMTESLRILKSCNWSGVLGEARNVAIKALEQESKTGRWIDHLEGRWMYAKCSECKTLHDEPSFYCPNCGALMEESEGEE